MDKLFVVYVLLVLYFKYKDLVIILTSFFQGILHTIQVPRPVTPVCQGHLQQVVLLIVLNALQDSTNQITPHPAAIGALQVHSESMK